MHRWIIGVILPALIFSGCLTASTKPKGGEELGSSISQLETWIKHDLLPELVKTLTNNPNLKNKPFTIAVWDTENNSIKTRINDLTKGVRDIIIDELLKHRGIDYVPRTTPKALSSVHHNSLGDINCREYKNIEFYLLLSTRISTLTDKLVIRVQIAFPDQEDFEFFSGISQTFECEATPKINNLLKKSNADEYLRGLRYLPFDETQHDLLASYLSHRVSCIFQNMSNGENLRVFIDDSGIDKGSSLYSTLKNIENYLDKFNEIRVTTNRLNANVTMTCNVIPTGGNLCQIWLVTETTQGEKIGATTEAYLKKN